MKFVPKHYQPRMFEWLISRMISALFASPGLGKTAVTLQWIDWLLSTGRSRGVLIIAPLRVCTITWPNQAAQWDHSSWMTVADMRTPEGIAHWEAGTADIYLINFEQLASRDVNTKCRTCKGSGCGGCKNEGIVKKHYPGFVEKFIKGRKKLPVDALVIDELSLAKSHSSKRINALRVYLKSFPHRTALTGSPVPNDYQDLFAQIRLLDGGERFGVSFTQYRNHYFEQADYMGYSYKLREGAKEKIDAKIADLALVMLSDDYLEVPTCATIDIEVGLSPAAKKAYKTLEKELLLELQKSEIVALNAATLSNKLLQVVGGAAYDADREVHVIHTHKIDALKALRKKHGKEPILVLTSFKHERERILKAIPGARMFDEKDMGKWQAGEIHTWVADFRSLSHGIDGIQKGGRIACWYSLPWSGEMYLQTNARVVRTGQSFETIIYRLICPGTIDDAVAEALREKTDTQSGLLRALKNLQKIAA